MGKTLDRKLKVGCFIYKVVFQEEDSDHGKTNVDTKTIYINTKFEKQIQRETLHHEILHICLDDYPLFGKDKMDAEEEEESIVRYISPKQVQIYRDNPWAKKFIFGGK